MNEGIFWNGAIPLPPILKEYSQLYDIPLLEEDQTIQEKGTLRYDDGILSYHENLGRGFSPLSFDFIRYWQYHLGKKYGLKNEPLAKALGVKGGVTSTVLDLTCGSGKDSFLMMAFGLKVVAFERNIVVGALLFDAYKRALAHELFANHIKNNFILNIGDSRNFDPAYIRQFNADVALIDPMYPKMEKSALPRKEMVIFRQLVGCDDDASDLLNWSLDIVGKRVVVKRGISAPELSCRKKITASYKGKSTRYDMYGTLPPFQGAL